VMARDAGISQQRIQVRAESRKCLDEAERMQAQWNDLGVNVHDVFPQTSSMRREHY
jgi:hypothetical protein